MELDEVLGGINRTDVNYPMLVLEGYSFDFTDNRSDNLLKNRKGAFMLIDHITDRSDFDSIHEIWDELEEIGTEILARIKSDKRDRSVPVVQIFNLEEVNADLLYNEIDGNVGIRFTYAVSSPAPGDIDATQWDLTK